MFNWTITDMQAVDGVIKNVKYHAELELNGKKVETEGYCYFDSSDGVPIESLTEENVINWVKAAMPTIEPRLQEQMNALEITSVNLPWKPATFKLST